MEPTTLRVVGSRLGMLMCRFVGLVAVDMDIDVDGSDGLGVGAILLLLAAYVAVLRVRMVDIIMRR